MSHELWVNEPWVKLWVSSAVACYDVRSHWLALLCVFFLREASWSIYSSIIPESCFFKSVYKSVVKSPELFSKDFRSSLSSSTEKESLLLSWHWVLLHWLPYWILILWPVQPLIYLAICLSNSSKSLLAAHDMLFIYAGLGFKAGKPYIFYHIGWYSSQ